MILTLSDYRVNVHLPSQEIYHISHEANPVNLAGEGMGESSYTALAHQRFVQKSWVQNCSEL